MKHDRGGRDGGDGEPFRMVEKVEIVQKVQKVQKVQNVQKVQKDRSELTITPKSLRLSFCSMADWLGDRYWKLGADSGLRVYLIHSILSLLNTILMVSAQLYTDWRSACSCSQSSFDLTPLQILVSSTKEEDLVPSDRPSLRFVM